MFVGCIQNGIKTTNFIIPNAYGPGDTLDPFKAHAINGMVIRLIKATRSNDPTFVIWGSGKPVREWAFVDDVSKLLILSINHDELLLDPINLGQGVGVSIFESAQTITEILNFEVEFSFDKSYQDGTPKKIMDGAKFKTTFPDFQFTDHRKGLEKTIKYYQALIK